MCAREPRISTKEPCTAAKESCISAKKTWNSVICAWYDAMQCWLTLSSDYCLFVCAKEPRISTKEPCAAANELCISAFPHKKSPGIMQFEQKKKKNKCDAIQSWLSRHHVMMSTYISQNP